MHQQGWSINTNPENSITFKKYLFSNGGKPMSFPIRKIGMLKMPKIAMLSTRRKTHVFSNPENWNAGNAENCDAVYTSKSIIEALTSIFLSLEILSCAGL